MELRTPDQAENSMKVEIHTLKWNGSAAVTDAEAENGVDANVTLYSRVFVGGIELPGVTRARVLFDNGGFTEAMIRLIGPIEVVNHTKESWDAL